MPQPLIDILHLKKYYLRRHGFFTKSTEPVRAVDGVNLKIFLGETVALIGESGSGKTTLAHCLLRIVKPTAGKIYFRGEEVWALQGEKVQQFRRQAQFIFQDADAALNPRRTVGSAIAEPLIAHGLLAKKAAHERACTLLQQAGLDPQCADSLPSELSSGQRHRAVIARALALQPKLIVADEPFSSLDVLAKSRLLDLFLALQRQFDLTLLVISHDLALVQQWCDRVLIMRAGKIAEAQPTS